MYYICITMTMSVTQVRLPEGLIREINRLVDRGIYTSKSDVVRDALRKLVLEKQIGSIPNSGDSVREVKEIRKKLSGERIDLDEINNLGE